TEKQQKFKCQAIFKSFGTYFISSQNKATIKHIIRKTINRQDLRVKLLTNLKDTRGICPRVGHYERRFFQ
ncbi:MAG: hypothetical protein IJ036_01985, partial [Lachnospiraceae bacterium]|nr:hypothetical protein [Lachnospiraceae bacterium]